MCIIGSVTSDGSRVLSVLVQQSGLLWLILTATVAKHSAQPTTTDVLTVFSGAGPIHCGFKAPLCFEMCWKAPNSLHKISSEPYFQWDHFLAFHNRSCHGNPMTVPVVETINVPPDWCESDVLCSGKRNRFRNGTLLFTTEFYTSLSHPWMFPQGCEDYWGMTLPHEAMLPSSGK